MRIEKIPGTLNIVFGASGQYLDWSAWTGKRMRTTVVVPRSVAVRIAGLATKSSALHYNLKPTIWMSIQAVSALFDMCYETRGLSIQNT